MLHMTTLPRTVFEHQYGAHFILNWHTQRTHTLTHTPIPNTINHNNEAARQLRHTFHAGRRVASPEHISKYGLLNTAAHIHTRTQQSSSLGPIICCIISQRGCTPTRVDWRQCDQRNNGRCSTVCFLCLFWGCIRCRILIHTQIYLYVYIYMYVHQCVLRPCFCARCATGYPVAQRTHCQYNHLHARAYPAYVFQFHCHSSENAHARAAMLALHSQSCCVSVE